MREDYRGYKKTNLKTYQYGKYRNVFERNGKLYYRFSNTWHGIFKEYCKERRIFIGTIDPDVFPHYKDACYKKKKGKAVVKYGEEFGVSNAFMDIGINLDGEAQAKAFLEYAHTHEHGTFSGNGYVIEF